jgi:hypothetical protein
MPAHMALFLFWQSLALASLGLVYDEATLRRFAGYHARLFNLAQGVRPDAL